MERKYVPGLCFTATWYLDNLADVADKICFEFSAMQ